MKKRKSIEDITHNASREKGKRINVKVKIIITLILVFLMIIIIALILLNFRNGGEKISELERKKIQASADISTWDTSKVTIVTDTSMGYEINVPIPEGYVMSAVTGETEVKTGLVIYEGEEAVTDSNKETAQKTRNQWVWIPVEPSEMYGTDASGNKLGKLYNFNNGISNNNWNETNGVMKINNLTSYREPEIVNDYDIDTYLTEYSDNLEMEHELLNDIKMGFNEIVLSVEKYGGFYIGRYETGNLKGERPIIVKGNTDIESQTWYTMFEKCKLIDEENKNVKTNMIYGSQWDAMLKYLLDSGSKTYEEVGENSTSWGNYRESTFEYIDESGGIVTKEANTTVKIPSGNSEYTKVNNIYDMAGNVSDWTAESYSSYYRVLRGYYCNSDSDYWCTGNRGGSSPTSSNDNYGSRVGLYL